MVWFPLPKVAGTLFSSGSHGEGLTLRLTAGHCGVIKEQAGVPVGQC